MHKIEPKLFVNGLLQHTPRWTTESTEFDDIILSTRIRLARNIKSYPFPPNASNEELRLVASNLEKAGAKIHQIEEAGFLGFDQLSKTDAHVLVERRLISPGHAEAKHPRFAVIDKAEYISIMVNEEDHLRLQSIQPGLALQEAWRVISRLDDEISENIDYAFSTCYGYLTSCPTNTGTGMRASIQVHLPALTILEKVDRIIKELAPNEIAVRGFYGEGSEIMGNIYQISNQLTLGRTEKAIVSRLEVVAHKFIEFERKAREELYESEYVLLEDKVFRSFAILQNARIMNSQEFLTHLSMVRLGVDMELITNIDGAMLNELAIVTQPAHMEKMHSGLTNAEQRDVFRAQIIRSRFSQE